MKVSELIEKLMDAMDKVGDVEVNLSGSVDDGEGEDRNYTLEIDDIFIDTWHREINICSNDMDYFYQVAYDEGA